MTTALTNTTTKTTSTVCTISSSQTGIVEGPEELWMIVAELWPELLHKIKPPRSLMH